MPLSNDPPSCPHENEVPNVCPCSQGCYCKGRNCSLAPVPEWRVIRNPYAAFPAPELIVLDVEDMGGPHKTEVWCQLHERALRGVTVLLALPEPHDESTADKSVQYYMKCLRARSKGEFRKGGAMTTPAAWVTAFQDAWFQHKVLKADDVPKKVRGRSKSGG